MRNSILRDLKVRFDKEGIEFAFPHRVIVNQSPPPLSAEAAGARPNPPGH
jgi:small-conductance mechanosensitive channel